MEMQSTKIICEEALIQEASNREQRKNDGRKCTYADSLLKNENFHNVRRLLQIISWQEVREFFFFWMHGEKSIFNEKGDMKKLVGLRIVVQMFF